MSASAHGLDEKRPCANPQPGSVMVTACWSHFLRSSSALRACHQSRVQLSEIRFKGLWGFSPHLSSSLPQRTSKKEKRYAVIDILIISL